MTITGSANDKSGGISNLTWDWFINFVVLGCLGLMSWGRFNQILIPVISIFSIVSLFFIYFFRVNKWNIAGPIFKLNALQELGWWRKIFERENYFQTDKTEPSEDGPNRTITANLVDCLSCGHPVPVKAPRRCGDNSNTDTIMNVQIPIIFTRKNYLLFSSKTYFSRSFLFMK